MKTLLISTTATALALLVVLSTRLLFPALEMVYYYILKSFEPVEPELQPALAAASTAPVVVTPVADKPAVKKTTARTTRKRVAKPKTAEAAA